MPIVQLTRHGADGMCWILPDGVINCPKEVIARLGWPNKVRVRPAYIASPLLLLFTVTEGREQGVQLRYTSPGSITGSSAAIKSKLLAKVIRLYGTLPQNSFYPIYPTNGLADLALLVEEPAWVPFSFDKTGTQEMAKKFGVYEFQDSKETIRYGQGNLSVRLRDHLGNPPLANDVRAARYFLVKDKEEAAALEHVLLCRFYQLTGRLPRYNAIKA